ncbi:hypothetical protein T440DRAFT_399928 [Plenodomus tracheiphilus IPT5]|uniref:RING-type domain-containing protein n=1 Tax=Plenodomus tracheiphilus IPT5 TaxID=1408161 RepID=A0A6A7B0M9_9PLEO|nr:hypothetical protein T440DRAFT_399928 [Plenodomus tracheiphilus IPT5]
MENLLDSLLLPAEDCVICGEAFGATHQPVALPCKHIFGYACIKRWLKDGKGNNSACPTCRYVLIEREAPQPAFNAPSLWTALTEQPPERLHALMIHVWNGLQVLWQGCPDGKFTVTQILDGAIIPALLQTGREAGTVQHRDHNIMIDCYNLIAGSWDSLGRPDAAIGLAIPLVRLARLMSSASTTLPKWLTTHPRANRLIWRANACLGTTETDIGWDTIIQAARLKDEQHFPLLYLYTVLLSQSIAHSSPPSSWPIKRHEIMNLVVERCCTRIGRLGWQGRPTNQFKEVLVAVYEDLRRYQLEKKRMSLRGHDGEDVVVKSIWALAGWSKQHIAGR